MAKKKENIYKRKDGRWEGRYKKTRNEDGKIIYGYVYGQKYALVQQELARKKLNFVDSKNQLFSGTASEWFDQWLNVHVATNVKLSTLKSYETKINNHIRPFFKKKLLISITKDDINEFIKYINSQDYSKNMLNSLLNILKNSLNCATKIGYLTENPSSEVILSNEKRRKIHALSVTDQTRLEFYAFQETDTSAVIIALATGMRIGEICGLKWTDIDFKENIIHIRRSLQRIPGKHEFGRTKVIIDSPKTASSKRDIPLASCFRDYLLEKRYLANSPYVVSSNGNYVEPRTITYRFKKLLIEAELEDINFHVLRHTFATRCVESGVDIASLSKILGHTSVKLTLDTYTDSLWQRRQEVMQVVDQSQFLRNNEKV
ncbi:tyrosine-type recombinase/integrase [Enterococcus sp. LJL99]